MSYLNLVWPIFLRFIFFLLNLYFTIHMTASFGWSFFSVLLAIFATRDLVEGIQMSQVLFHLKKLQEKNNLKK